ncbi:unnamed protein product [Porites evermanni]|nr:unnamed protein product [Porites evermanni]
MADYDSTDIKDEKGIEVKYTVNLNVVLLGSQDPSILKQEIELELKKETDISAITPD